jgi:hypothetical protein
MPARLNRERNAVEIEVEADDLARLNEVEPRALPRFSDDDLLTALFRTTA